MCVCVFLHLISPSSSHVANNGISSSLCLNDILLCIYATYSIYSSVGGYLGWALDAGCEEQYFIKHESVEDISLTH